MMKRTPQRLALVLAALVLLAPAAAAQTSGRRIQEIETPAGIKVWFVEERRIPLVAIRFAMPGGALLDPDGKDGLAAFVAGLQEGAGDLDSAAFARRVAAAGAELGMGAARDHISGGLTVLSRRLGDGAELLRLWLNAPRFDAPAIERVRAQRQADLEYAASEPRSIALDRWYGAAFPGQPYARPLNGTLASLKAITAADLKAQHGRLITRHGLRVVVVGDLSAAEATRHVDAIFAALPAGKVEVPGPREPAPGAQPIVVERKLPLATAAFGLPGLRPSHPDFPALLILNRIIGSGDFDATLMEEIRVKRGLAYAVQISLIHDQVSAVMLGGMSTKNESMAEALAVLSAELKRMAADGPSEEQFANARAYLMGSYLLDLDTNARLAASLLRLWLDGFGPAYLSERNRRIEAVTLADVRRVARDLLKLERMLVTVVGATGPLTKAP